MFFEALKLEKSSLHLVILSMILTLNNKIGDNIARNQQISNFKIIHQWLFLVLKALFQWEKISL